MGLDGVSKSCSHVDSSLAGLLLSSKTPPPLKEYALRTPTRPLSMTQSLRLRFLLMSIASLSVGCGSDDANLDAVKSSQSALSGNHSEPSTCTESQLSSPSGSRLETSCEGPWEFHSYTTCHAKRAAPPCTRKPQDRAEETAATCRHPFFGLERVENRNYSATITPIKSPPYIECIDLLNAHDQQGLGIEQESGEQPQGLPPGCFWVHTLDHETPCQQRAETERSKVHANDRDDVSIANLNVDLQTKLCTFTLTSFPVYKPGTSQEHCGTTTILVPDYEACRAPEHGLATDPAECYREAPSDTLIQGSGPTYSPPGLKLSGLRGLPAGRTAVLDETPAPAAPRCMTADELPHITQAEVELKFERLRDSLGTLELWEDEGLAPVPLEHWPALRRELAFRMKLLAERKGHLLSQIQREFMLGRDATPSSPASEGLYQRFPGTGYHRVRQIDGPIDFNWGANSPAPGIPADNFSTRWHGRLVAPESGNYTLTIESSDGARLWFEGSKSIDRWEPTPKTASTVVHMVAGNEYEIRFETFHWTGAAHARLLWNRPNSAPEPVPATQLRSPAGNESGLVGDYFDNTYIDHSNYTPAGFAGSNFDADPQCGNPWFPPVDDASCAGARETNALLDMCRRFASNGASETYAAFISRCHDVLPRIAALTECNATDRTSQWKAYDEFVHAPLEAYVGPTEAQPQSHQPALRDRLALIDTYHHQNQTHRDQHPDDTGTPLPDRTRRLVTQVWHFLYEGSELPTPDSEATQAAFSEASLNVDLAMLEAAFPDKSSNLEPPMTSAALLMVVGDSLKGMTDRLGYAEQLHDYPCMFRDCAAGARRTPISQTWKLLDGLRNQQRLNAAMADITNVPAAWAQRFTAIQHHYPTLRGAVAQSLGRPEEGLETLLQLSSEQLPDLAVELTRTLHLADGRHASYLRSGRFDNSTGKVLWTGISPSQQSTIEANVYGLNHTLGQTIADFDNHRATYVIRLLGIKDNQGHQNELDTRTALLMDRWSALSEDLAGLQRGIELSTFHRDELFNRFIKRVEDTTDPTERIPVGPGRAALSVPASATSWTQEAATPSDPLSSLAATTATGPWSLDAASGDLIQITFSQNQWSATCAAQRLQRNGLQSELPMADSTAFIPPNGTPFGPEGILLTQSGSGYQVTSNTRAFETGQHASADFSASICAGIQIDAGATTLIGGSKTYVNMEGCLKAQSGASSSNKRSEQVTGGEELRLSAQYMTGLRLQGVPFPRLPVGSLLLVEAPLNATSRRDITDVHVLRSGTNMVFTSKPSRLFLVVNDRASTPKDPCDTSQGGALSFAVEHARTLTEGSDPTSGSPLAPGSAVAQFGAALVSASSSVASNGAPYLNQGTITTTELGVLRSLAINSLQDELGTTPISAFPESLVATFLESVDLELAQLERRARVRAVEREMGAIILELRGAKSQLEHIKETAPLLSLLATWQLRNLEGVKLEGATRDLIRASREYLYPSMRILYPRALLNLQNDPDATDAMNRIQTASWEDAGLEMARQAHRLIGRVKVVLDAEKLAYNSLPPDRFTVAAISFPRPGVYPWQQGPFDPPSPETPWSTADAERAEKVWTALEQGDWAVFDVRPEDLYAFTGGPGRFVCSYVTPVIRSVGIHFAYRGTKNLNILEYQLPLSVGRQLAYTTASGLETYEQRNDDWLSGGIHVTFGNDDEAIQHFRTFNAGFRDGAGLTPFGRFKINSTAILPELNDINQAILVFEVEKRTDASPKDYITTCDGTPPPAGFASELH